MDLSAAHAEILREARSLHLPSGTAESIADQVIQKVESRLARQKSPPQPYVLNNLIKSELAKYNPDLAYLYENRGKII